MLSVLVISFLGWQESRQVHRFRLLRIFTQAVAILALLALVLRPSYMILKEKPKILLLTENYSASVADSIMRTNKEIKTILGPGVRLTDDLERIESYHQLTEKGILKYVLGDGVPLADLDILKEQSFVYFGTVVPSGIVQLGVEKNYANRWNWIRGRVHNLEGGVIRLNGPGGLSDSVTIRASGDSEFNLGFFSKLAGRFAYSITIADKSGKSYAYEFPVEVLSPRKLAILILQQYPQAETKFLKNYLSEEGHSLVVRYRVSRNNVRYEFANGATQRADKLTLELLRSFDLVLTDDETYGGLAAPALDALKDGVDNGLGLLILFNRSVPPKQFVGNSLELVSNPQAEDTIRFRISDFGSFTCPVTALKLRRPERIQAIMNTGNSVLSGYQLMGTGKIGFQLLRETYRLSLKGESGPYAALWTPVLEQLARRETVKFSTRVTTDFPIYPNEPVTFDVVSSNGAPTVLVDGIRTPMIEDVTVDDWWHGKTWADSPGWHSLKIKNDSVRTDFYVSKKDSWTSLRLASQQRANTFRKVRNDGQIQEEMWTVRKPVSPMIFFALFLISSGFLWLAPKL